MPISPADSCDVVIVGAGPVGLFLACELGLAGCAVLVLEQAEDPASPFKALPFGLRGLSVPTAESLDRRGLLEAVDAGAAGRDGPATAHWTGQRRRPGGHFAGIPFFHDRIDAGRWPYRLAGSAGILATDMAHLETVLAARAEALGVAIRRGCGVDGVEPAEDGVTVRAGGATVRGRWLVGCDGARSAVRKAAGIGFSGTDPEFTGYSAQVVLADPDALPAGRRYTAAGMYTFAPPGTLAMVDFDGGAFHRTRPITRAHVEAVLRRVSGTDVAVTALERATTWTDRAFQATAYRAGRVLLAGDAAHVHAPLGGQGLNLGLGDAMNLGWKLAATLRGDAPAGLLDSYARERAPAAAQVLHWSRAQVALMRPSPSSRALEAIVRDLIETRDGATYFAERVWGVGLRYDLGDDHPLLGRSAPDFALADGTRLAEHLRTGRGVILDVAPSAALEATARRWGARIRYGAGAAVPEAWGARAILVRPDGVVAWVGDGASRPDDALRRWFGEPDRRPEDPDGFPLSPSVF
ncbi:FAD-dependent monooxygenase [Methylobacterium sp. NEAU 140]|uniref:FAD-dependent monooxygenase n=1 Tax=Methylobacterium sp. NEAU 140 TaxID=3064945 RepID=UPI00273341BB|nr:FAD-dependent monooxygenase [Methylobacterium sp. NEAU 140]MDP4024836.1 FAD-dependent monooxygenase [Methylobacterium sp. NEAU 140]